MNIEKEDLGQMTAKLKLSISTADYKPQWEASLRDYRKRAALPGFRQGQVPASLIMKKFGKSLLAEQINDLINRELNNYLTENKIAYLGNPLPLRTDYSEGNWDQPSDFRFEYEIGIAPNFQVKLDDKKKHIRYRIQMDDKFMQERIQDLARRYGKLSEPEVSEDNDMLIGSFIQLDDHDQILPGGIFHDSTISIEYLKDQATRQQLIGLCSGSEVVVDPHKVSQSHDDLGRMLGITHAQVHHLHGNFLFRVKEIKRLTPTEIDQALFDRILGKDAVSDLDGFKARIAADFERRFERDSDNLFNRHLVEEVIDSVNLQLPDEFLKRWMLASGNAEMSSEELEFQYPQYARALRWQLIEQRVMVDNQIQIKEEDLRNHAKTSIASQYAQYGIPMSDEQLEPLAANALKNEKDRKEIFESILEGKVVDALRSSINITDEYITHEAFAKRVNEGNHHHHH